MTQVAFYYSIGSRYSYLSLIQISALEEHTSYHIEWYPVNSVDLISRSGHNPFRGTPVSGQYNWDYRELDAKRWADYSQVKFSEPMGRVEFDSQLIALATVAEKRLGKIKSFSPQLYAAMFCNRLSKIDKNEPVSQAQKCDISEQGFRPEIEDDNTTIELENIVQNALQIGVFGVPTFIVNDQMFGGMIELALLQHYIEQIKEFG